MNSDEKVIKVVQELLDSEQKKGNVVTSDLVHQKIDLALTLDPDWAATIDREAVVSELIRRFSIWIGKSTVIYNENDHKAWLNSERKHNWRYWQRYREYLEKNLDLKSVDSVDESTDNILRLLEDPLRDGSWDRRGLVVGHVQSGKTANYTGLICKSADAGYKIIIILAGMHNNLRSQTQIRLDEGFLGFDSSTIKDGSELVGVGLIDSDQNLRPNTATHRGQKGDFNTRVANHLGVTPEERPWLFVVKKNKTVLKRLYEWILQHVTDSQDTKSERKIVTKFPLLMVDDEADNASVDTGDQAFNENGEPDDEYSPTAINSLIRKILHTFTKVAYVAYTATPFANIFIHQHKKTKSEGPDLFPSSFILNLSAPSTYIGPTKIFGIEGDSHNGLPLIRIIKDSEQWIPPRHKKEYIPKYQDQNILPPSLQEAILSFLLVCAVRACRGYKNMHSSMLVHVTRFVDVQKHVASQIAEYIKNIRQKLRYHIDDSDLMNTFYELWYNDNDGFLSTNNKIIEIDCGIKIDRLPPFQDVISRLNDIVSDIEVKMINGQAKDVLDYKKNNNIGLKVIAVGGDKLSRGLTLDGLSISYFLRSSRMYDTLMQMGRWFGYRKDYLDVCRLYISEELSEWYRHITEASEELRSEFDLAVDSGMTPREYGLKVRAHPTLMITSRVKMRSSKKLMLSFSGQRIQTVALHMEPDILEHNYKSLENFISKIGNSEESPVVRLHNGSRMIWDGHMWSNILSDEIINFLKNYKSHETAYRVNTEMISQFIERMNLRQELTTWSVALIGSNIGRIHHLTNEISTKLLKRAATAKFSDRYSIGVLTSPRDESIDLSDRQWDAALQLTKNAWHLDPGRSNRYPVEPSGPAIRKIRGFGSPEFGVDPHPEKGLMLLYLLDPAESELAGLMDRGDGPPIVAFALSFPGSSKSTKVKYMVNNVYWEQEYAPA
ncbi:MAG: Z1 domain-containing protein [Lachnospiraceae bacterium]|nr:Z1 domain-containing protein [Lachnospiraceae bacterium]